MPSIHIPNALPMGWEYLPTAISPCENVAMFHQTHVGNIIHVCGASVTSRITTIRLFSMISLLFINTPSRYTGGESDHHSHIFRDSNMGVGLGISMGPAYHQGVHLYKLYVMLM